ncbi:MAG: ABC transporter permease subunit [Candidatus Omnitrophica bacterium]|nr:ABC transporter permease subunit [Candidatus Omnitrophota bacterium]
MTKVFIIAKHTFKELVRKKDFYVLLFLFLGVALFLYNETFFGIEDISRYLKDVGLSLIVLFSVVISITFAAKQIPQEIESRTIYPLLAKPISRTQLILGKFFGGLLISVISFTSFYILYLVLIFTKGEGAGIMLVLQTYFLTVLLLCLISAFTVLFSLLFTVSANITLVLLLYFFIYWYNGFLKNILLNSGQKISTVYAFLYYILPHFEFYDMRVRLVHEWDALGGWVVLSIFLYTVIYIFLMIWAACALFKRKNL